MNRITAESAEFYQGLREAMLVEIRDPIARQVREDVMQAYQSRLLGATAREQQRLKREMEKEIAHQTKLRCDARLAEAGLPETSTETLW